MTSLIVAPVDVRAARYAVEHWHYSRRMPVGVAQRYGVWEDGRFVGCVLFGRGASPHLGARLGVSVYELCELTRIALREHQAPVSQIAARAIRRLRSTSPGTRLIVSFADPAHGHHGGIYQAMSWLYLGATAPSRAYRERATGRLAHQRVVTNSGVGTQFGRRTRTLRKADCEVVVVPGKHRYVLPLDRAMRRRLEPLALPFPTAVEVSTGDANLTGLEGRVRSSPTARAVM